MLIRIKILQLLFASIHLILMIFNQYILALSYLSYSVSLFCQKISVFREHFVGSTYLYIVVHDPTGISEVWVLCVDVSQLNCNQVMDLIQEKSTTEVIEPVFKLKFSIKQCNLKDVDLGT